MAASEAAVTAVMETLGCKPYDGVWNWANKPTCDRHGNDIWTDRGCPVAVAAADAAVDADRASIQAETLREAADEIEAVVRASAEAKTRRVATSKRQQERDKATGHRLGASLTAVASLRARADRIEGKP